MFLRGPHGFNIEGGSKVVKLEHVIMHFDMENTLLSLVYLPMSRVQIQSWFSCSKVKYWYLWCRVKAYKRDPASGGQKKQNKTSYSYKCCICFHVLSPSGLHEHFVVVSTLLSFSILQLAGEPESSMHIIVAD